jgi:hypothetical protein
MRAVARVSAKRRLCKIEKKSIADVWLMVPGAGLEPALALRRKGF